MASSTMLDLAEGMNAEQDLFAQAAQGFTVV